MGWSSGYRTVLAVPEVRSTLVLSFLIRVPLWASTVVVTLHVVGTLGRSYSEAGLLAMAGTVAVAISGPWRGRKLDQIGLRATVGPQLLVLLAVWSVAPWVGYAPLLVLYVVAGLATIGTFSILRQVLITAVEDHQRQTVLSLDSLAVELSFMIGPVVGVLLATYFDTRYVLLGTQMLVIAAGALLWWMNPRLVHEDEEESPRAPWREWVSARVLVVLAAGAATTVVLTGTDLGIVAALRAMDDQALIGVVMAIWGAGSALGALAYGAFGRPIPVFWLLLGLSLATVPVAFTREPLLLTTTLFVAGFFCAPTITSTVDSLSRYVPANVRGEAMGWHGSALMLGSAAGAPLAGFAIDGRGWQAGFLVTAGLGTVVAAVGLAFIARQKVAVRGTRVGGSRVNS